MQAADKENKVKQCKNSKTKLRKNVKLFYSAWKIKKRTIK